MESLSYNFFYFGPLPKKNPEQIQKKKQINLPQNNKKVMPETYQICTLSATATFPTTNFPNRIVKKKISKKKRIDRKKKKIPRGKAHFEKRRFDVAVARAGQCRFPGGRVRHVFWRAPPPLERYARASVWCTRTRFRIGVCAHACVKRVVRMRGGGGGRGAVGARTAVARDQLLECACTLTCSRHFSKNAPRLGSGSKTAEAAPLQPPGRRLFTAAAAGHTQTPK